MKTTILFLSLLVCGVSLFGQTITRKYDFLIRKADSLYQVKDFKNSAFAFSAAFKAPDSKITAKKRDKQMKYSTVLLYAVFIFNVGYFKV